MCAHSRETDATNFGRRFRPQLLRFNFRSRFPRESMELSSDILTRERSNERVRFSVFSALLTLKVSLEDR